MQNTASIFAYATSSLNKHSLKLAMVLAAVTITEV